MNTKPSTSNIRHRINLLICVITIFAAIFILAQMMFSPSIVSTVYAGSTLTPTSVPAPTDPPPTDPPPTNTPVPPTSTPPPAATNTPAPAPTNPPSTGGSNEQPTPTSTPEPVIPQEIPELGFGSDWGPLLLTLAILTIALAVAAVQVRHLLRID